MKRSLTLHSKDFWEVVREQNAVTHTQLGTVEEYHVKASGLGMDVVYREIVLPGIWIQVTNLNLPYQFCLHCEIRQDMYQMHYGLAGYEYALLNGLHLNVYAGNSNFFFLPKGVRDYPEHGHCENHVTFQVNFANDYLDKMLGDLKEYYPEFFQRVERREMALLGERMPILPEMRMIINDIIHCKLPVPLNKMYLEAKVNELFVFQMSQFRNVSQEKYKLKIADVNKLQMVKEILSTRHLIPSLQDLATESGLNIDKLKKGFKALYGTTVFGYLSDLRMEEARQLLIETALSVTEVADKIGYKNSQHFTVAFKKKFGVLPRELKR